MSESKPPDIAATMLFSQLHPMGDGYLSFRKGTAIIGLDADKAITAIQALAAKYATLAEKQPKYLATANSYGAALEKIVTKRDALRDKLDDFAAITMSKQNRNDEKMQRPIQDQLREINTSIQDFIDLIRSEIKPEEQTTISLDESIEGDIKLGNGLLIDAINRIESGMKLLPREASPSGSISPSRPGSGLPAQTDNHP